MGLDSVELLMAVEETFGINVTDEEAEKTVTVGALQDIVWEKVGGAGGLDSHCATMHVFHRLRQGFMDCFHTAREAVRPATPVDDLVPRQDRRIRWTELETATGLRLPGLERARWVKWMGSMSAMAIGIAAWLAWGWYTSLPVFAAFTGLLIVATRPLRTEIGKEFLTVRRLSHQALRRNFQSLSTEQQGKRVFTRAEVDQIVKDIIVEQLGVTPEQVVPEARFIQDLGVD